MVDKQKLTTATEKELYKFVRMIKEHTRDFTVLYLRRNNIEVDSQSMARILDVVDEAIMDGFQKHIDRYMKGVDKAISELVKQDAGDDNKNGPLQHTSK